MATSKRPTTEFYWTTEAGEQRVNWRLRAANGEIVCESRQGFRDRVDAARAVDTAVVLLGAARRSGPGAKPEQVEALVRQANLEE